MRVCVMKFEVGGSIGNMIYVFKTDPELDDDQERGKIAELRVSLATRVPNLHSRAIKRAFHAKCKSVGVVSKAASNFLFREVCHVFRARERFRVREDTSQLPFVPIFCLFLYLKLPRIFSLVCARALALVRNSYNSYSFDSFTNPRTTRTRSTSLTNLVQLVQLVRLL